MAFGFTYTLPTITGTHTDLPVVLKTADFPTAAVDGGSSSLLNGGGDLRAYTSSAKTTQLPLQVIRFVTGGTPDCQVWVKVPSAATSSTIYLEADDVETTQPAVTNAFGRNAVWADYVAVWHLDSLTDSTGNAHDLAEVGSPSAGETDPFGSTGAYRVTGGNYLEASSWAKVPQPFWAQAWVKPDSGITQTIFSQGSSLENSWEALLIRATSKWEINYSGAGTPSGADVTNGVWQLAHTRMFGGEPRVYDNGVNVVTGTQSGEAGTKDEFALGILLRTGSQLNLAGYLSEVWVRETPPYTLPDDLQAWSETEYSNQSAATAWGTVGDWEDSAGGITGSGTPQATTATASAAGIIGRSGTGTPQAATATTSAAGVIGRSGTGEPQAETATSTGSGSVGLTGSGSPQAETATTTASGTLTRAGTGSPQAETATTTASGTLTKIGTAVVQSATATATASGVIGRSGTGSPQAGAASVTASGSVVKTGTGSPQAATATASGEGVVSAIGVVTGSGSPQAVTATASGEGIVIGTGGDGGTRRQRSMAALVGSRRRRRAA